MKKEENEEFEEDSEDVDEYTRIMEEEFEEGC
jgi:hypothetical protein